MRHKFQTVGLTTSGLFIGFCLLGSSIHAASEFKLGYVDLQKALHTVEAGIKAKSKLETDAAKLRKNLEKEQLDLQKEAESFEKKSAIMNERAKAKKQAELQKRFVEFQKKMQESQLKLRKLETELTEPIIKELRSIVEALGKERKFQLIVEKNESAVLYSSGGSDITEEVVARFNKSRKRRKKKKG